MNPFASLWRRLQYLRHRSQHDADLAEEMRLHMELRAEQATAEGKDPAESRRRFGNTTLLQEDSRSAWGWTFFDNLTQDLRYGLRTLLADPTLTLTAVLSLTLGIGANTAIFSLMNAVMLRTLPLENPQSIVALQWGNQTVITNPLWEAIRDNQQSLASVAAYSYDNFDLSNGGEVRRTNGLYVSGSYFATLGIPAWRGRLITQEDDVPGGSPAGMPAVISHAFWQANYNGDPQIIGKTLTLDRQPFQIVGITPPWFTGLQIDHHFTVAIPIGAQPRFNPAQNALGNRSWWWLRGVARLKPGVSAEAAQSQLNAIAPEILKLALPQHWPTDQQKRFLDRRFSLPPGASGYSQTGRQYKDALYTLLAVAGLVLLIACANIANLLLARATARSREIAVRLAIGADRARILRQLITESLLLGLAGATGGILASIGGSRLLVNLVSTTTEPLDINPTPDWRVLAFTMALALLTSFVFGLLPAWRASSVAPNQSIKENARGSVHGASRFYLGKALVTGQIALSLLLLVAATLFLSTFRNLTTVDLGFNKENVLIVNAAMPANALKPADRIRFFERTLAQLRQVPGVSSAASVLTPPLSGIQWNNEVLPQGHSAKLTNEEDMLWFNRVSSSYLQTIGTPLLLGRDFDERDTRTSSLSIIISESAARRFWGDGNPLGRTIRIEEPPLSGAAPVPMQYTVIGITRDIKYADIDEKLHLTGYVSQTQDPDPDPFQRYVLRLTQSPALIMPTIRANLAQLSPDLSIEFRLLDQQIADSLRRQRLVAYIGTFFGTLALLLAAIGLYGIIAYSTARRRNEIGLRVALGAHRSSILWLVLKDVTILLTIGCAVGLAASLAAGRYIESMVYGTRVDNPAYLALSALILLAATTCASYWPARRAANMDPMSALREE